MQTVYAPGAIPNINLPKVFLAGSIEMGKADDWQVKVVNSVADMDVILLNPRRPDWDSTWKQDPNTEPFRTQVIWEQHGLVFSDIIFFNFCAGTQSPITLLELGQSVGKYPIVCCPKEYFRYGNVAIVCELHNVEVYTELETAIVVLKRRIDSENYWRNRAS